MKNPAPPALFAILAISAASMGSAATPTPDAPATAVYPAGALAPLDTMTAVPADESRLRVPKAGTNLLVNGSFEQNDGVDEFTGWRTFNDRLDGIVSGWWVQSGTTSPLDQFSGIPAPTDGEFAAVSEQNGPGVNILYQDVTIPPQGATLSCDLWAASVSIVNDTDVPEPWVVPRPPTFDFRDTENQQLRVDIVTTNTVLGLGTAVLRNLFSRGPGDATFFGPATLNADLGEFAGQRVRLRFAEVDTNGYLLFGVDNCSIVPKDGGETPIFGDETQIVPGSVEPRVPTVQYNPDGTKAVIWMQNGGGGTIICIQIIDANDQSVTTPLIVNTTGVVNETPTVGVRPDGTYQIVWRQADGTAIRTGDGRLSFAAGAGSSIVSRGFTNTGTGVGNDQVVSSAGPDDSKDPSAATDKNGNTAVTWEDEGEVKGRVLGSNGAPRTGIFDITGALGPGATKPVVTTSASGDIIAVWRQTAGVTRGILARVIDQNGNPVTSFIQVESAVNARAPDVAADDFGNFIVVWDANGQSGRDIFGRRYSRNGTPEGPALILNDNVAGDQTNPRVSRSASGDFVTVWQSDTSPASALFPPNAVSVGGGTSIVSRGFNGGGEAQTEDVVVAETEAGTEPETPDVDLDDRGMTTVTFERKNNSGDSAGIFRREVLLPKPPAACAEDSKTLCLNGDRFRVRAEWEAANGSDRGSAFGTELTDDTGYFYFFNPENVEVVVKSLDACGFAGSFWVFAGGLTDVEVTLVVEDTLTGEAISYFNGAGPYIPIRDTAAFATCGASATERRDPDQISQASLALRAELEALAAADLDELGRTREQAGVGGGCFSTATRLCLNNGRFSVEVDFDTGSQSGPALRTVLTSETGYFTFFDPDNVEVVVKVLNACGINNRYWVFAAGLTDVEVDLVVTDTQTGSRQTYRNGQGNPFQPINDTNAFRTCP